MKEKLYTVYSYLKRFMTISCNENGDIVKHTFQPGENAITESVFSKIKKTAMFIEQVECGNFDAPEEHGEVVKIGKPDDKGYTAAALKQMNVSDLKKKILGSNRKDGIIDVELLYRLKEIEDRNTVINTINKQFDKLGVKY